MFGDFVEVSRLRKRVMVLENDLTLLRLMGSLDVDRAKFETAKACEKALIESDLKRVEAVAKLNTYIDMDTKDDKKAIKQMLADAIKALGNQKVTITK